jgi:hypothetical protein
MRKIEKQMMDAVINKTNFTKDNTGVFFISSAESGNPHGARSEIFLHNNHIADFWHESKTLDVDVRTLSRWPTPTTKSRLRALGAHVTTKNGVTFLDNVKI